MKQFIDDLKTYAFPYLMFVFVLCTGYLSGSFIGNNSYETGMYAMTFTIMMYLYYNTLHKKD